MFGGMYVAQRSSNLPRNSLDHLRDQKVGNSSVYYHGWHGDIGDGAVPTSHQRWASNVFEFSSLLLNQQFGWENITSS